jgi:basic amino acid/polyamine antiporter, APA family
MKQSKPQVGISGRPRRELTLIDSTSIIVGIIIGSTIYESSPDIAAGAGRWASELAQRWHGSVETQTALAVAATMGIWIIGGLIALVGALCYAELATAYPEAGGTYVYLSEALGRNVGFAFAWAEFWIVRPGNVGAIAFVLASYGKQIVGPYVRDSQWIEPALAIGAIVTLAVINAMGLRAGKWTQNLLTSAKLLGLGAIVVTACTLGRSVAATPLAAESWHSLSLSLILVMFAYGGWADMSFVAAEVRDPERNISRALILGTVAVTTIYLAINLAFIGVLGIGSLTASQAVAALVMALRFGSAGSLAISLLVVISCLGSINGMMFAGARVFYALGEHHPTFRWLGVWDESKGVPLRSLLVQTLVTLGLVVGFGLWPGGFKGLVVFTGPFYWGFIGLVGLALIVLRKRRVNPGSYRVPLYPLVPLLLLASGGAMALAAVQYVLAQRTEAALWIVGAVWAFGVIAVGIVVGLLDWRGRRP